MRRLISKLNIVLGITKTKNLISIRATAIKLGFAAFTLVVALFAGFAQVNAGAYERIYFSAQSKAYMYSTDSNGQNLKDLGQGYHPRISPDGSVLLYDYLPAAGSSYYDLFVKNTSGTTTNLTNTPGSQEDLASWSPDGQHILYRSITLSTNVGGFFVMNSDGSNPHQILPNAEWASYSPDGSKIVFSDWGQNHATLSIAVANSDGTNMQVIHTNDTGYEPAWSPDGNSIAWRGACAAPYLGQMCIRVMNPDGSNIRDVIHTDLINGGHDYEQPAWSTDSSRIFVTALDTSSIFAVSVSSGFIQTLYTDSSSNEQLTFPVANLLNDTTAPIVSGASVNPLLVMSAGTITVSASASDADSGVSTGEFYIDTDPGLGSGTPMIYASTTGKITGGTSLTSSTPSSGLHTVYVRAKDNAGNWSATTQALLIKL